MVPGENGRVVPGGVEGERAEHERSGDAGLRELLARNAELRAMFQAFPDTLFRVDSEGAILDCNAGRADNLLLPPERFIGKRIQSVLPQPLRRAFEEALARVAETGEVSAIEYPLTVPSGKKYWEARLVRTSAGQLFAIVRDITARVQTQEALRRAEAQFLQAQKMETVGRLAGGIAHDFNNLLTTILGLGEIVGQQVPAGSTSAADVAEIVETARRAARLTQQLLAFSRRQVVEPKVIGFGDVLPDLTRMLGRLIGENIELVVRMTPGLGLVRIDPGQMEQLIVNLAVNARDAMPHGGKLTFEAANVSLGARPDGAPREEASGEYVRLAVSDTGVGMTDEVKAHVFEPFFTTKEIGRGTGLGLATCFGIVKQNHGHISFESELGRGTTFVLYLPRVRGDAEPVRESAREPLPRGDEAVLLVEDDAALRRLVARALSGLGYEVREAEDGEAGLAAALADAGGRLDLVLTDVIMPKRGGLLLVEEIHRARPDVKIVFMTGYTNEPLLHSDEAGRDWTLLRKPFTIVDLARTVRAALDA